MNNNCEYKTVIKAKRKLFDLHIKETFKYKDLIFLFVKRDFISLYKQTILGPLWAIISPLLTTFVFTFVFGSLANITTLDTLTAYVVPSFLFYMAGNICWGYFSSTFSATANVFNTNRHIMGKVYYPRLVAPISITISKLISFAISFALFIIIWAIYLIKGGTSLQVSVNLLFIPLCVLQLMVLAMGLGIIVSSVTTKYKDLQMLVGFIISLWQFASPIAYGLSLVENQLPNLMWLYMLNPITTIITTFRYATFGFGYFNITYYLISWGISILLLFIGLMLFSKTERTFMDTI